MLSVLIVSISILQERASMIDVYVKNVIVGLFIFGILLMSLPINISNADDKILANGCGPMGYGFLVPDSAIISKCNFKSACDTHDICYGRCLESGDLYGQATCNNPKEKKERRASCDNSIRSSIESDNSDRTICNIYASAYYWAVSRFGAEHFRGVNSGQDGNSAELSRFLSYVEANPEHFNLQQSNKFFISDTSGSGKIIGVVFKSWGPTLEVTIEENGEFRALELKGTK